MTKNTTNDTDSAAWVYVGLDVHKETFAVAAAKLDKADCLVLGSSPTHDAPLLPLPIGQSGRA